MIKLINKLFTDEYPDLHEDVKYGGLVFIKSGLLTAGIFPYKNHISIEFSNGADFDDPSKLLEGKGAKRRHLKIIDKNHLNENIIAFFIKQAANE